MINGAGMPLDATVTGAIDGIACSGLECRLLLTLCVVAKAMRRFQSLPCRRQPALDGLRRAWPSDTVLKRRRSVLFAFTFSPHLN